MDDKKSILLVSHNLNLEGAPTMLLRIAEILKEAGYDIFLISMSGGYYEDKLTKLDIPFKIINDDFNVVNRDLDELFLNRDLVICNTIVTSKIISRYNNIIPIVWYIRENIVIEEYTKLISDLRYNLKTKDNIYTVSELCKECIEKNFDSKDIKVVHNYHNAEAVSNAKRNNSSKINILYIGTIDNRKGLDLLLEANRRLKNRDNLTINYAGSILDKVYYDDIISSYKEPNINYLGVIKGEEKTKIIENTDIIAVPSRDEPASLVVIEALSSSIPVIISEMVGLKYAINESNGFIFDLNNIDSLTEILRRLNNGEIDLDSYKENAHKAYKEFVNLDTYKKNIIDIIENNSNKKNVSYFTRCINCGICKIKCEFNLIEYKQNEYGYFVPVVDETKCKKCGKCADICPVISIENKIVCDNSINDFNPDKSLHELVKNKKELIAPIWENDRVVYSKATEDNIDRIQYIPLFEEDSSEITSIIKNELLLKKKITFLGTPCKVFALKKLFPTEDIEYICTSCNGINNSKLLLNYLKRENSNIKNVRFIKEKIITYDFLQTYHIANKIICEYDDSVVEYDENSAIVKAINFEFTKKRECFECPFISGIDKRDENYTFSRVFLQDKIAKSDNPSKEIDKNLNNDFDLLIFSGLKDLSHPQAMEIYAIYKGLEKENISSAIINYVNSDELPKFSDAVAFLFGNIHTTTRCHNPYELDLLNVNCNNFAALNLSNDRLFDFQREVIDLRFVNAEKNILLFNIKEDDIVDNNIKYQIEDVDYISSYSQKDLDYINSNYDFSQNIKSFNPFILLLEPSDIKNKMSKDRYIVREYTTIYFDSDIEKEKFNNENEVVIDISMNQNYYMEKWLNVVYYSEKIITDNINLVLLGIVLNKQIVYINIDNNNLLETIQKEINANISIINSLDYNVNSKLKNSQNDNTIQLIKEKNEKIINGIKEIMNSESKEQKENTIRLLGKENAKLNSKLNETEIKLKNLENAYSDLQTRYNSIINSRSFKVTNKIKTILKGNNND